VAETAAEEKDVIVYEEEEGKVAGQAKTSYYLREYFIIAKL
jgi:hypothetical protein